MTTNGSGSCGGGGGGREKTRHRAGGWRSGVDDEVAYECQTIVLFEMGKSRQAEVRLDH